MEKTTVTINNLQITGVVSHSVTPDDEAPPTSLFVANFLNIPYARIAARWHQAIPIDPRQEKGSIDAVFYGPRCPQQVDVLHHSAVKHLHPRLGTFERQSEFECLNLNIYTPADAVAAAAAASEGRSERKKRLPVLVWIHGGALIYGDGGCEFDGHYLVERSISLGKPLIVVSLNYRLGYFGFLSSKELRDEARARGEVGYNNLGFHDQRVALQWVQKNIHFFGGDGFRVTVAGESAGAYSIVAHLRSDYPAFQQAFIMSCPDVTPRPLSATQKTFDRFFPKATHLPLDAPAGDKLAALRSLSPQDLGKLLDGESMPVSQDEAFFTQLASNNDSLDEIAVFPSWVKSVVVGQTKHEMALFGHKWATMSAEELYRDWKDAFPDQEYAKEVLNAYGITETSRHAELFSALTAYMSDVVFSKATHSISSSSLASSGDNSTPVFLYSFDQGDVLSKDPTFKDNAYHSLDNPFLFYFPQVTEPAAPPAVHATAAAYSKACIDYVNGEDPWEAFNVGRKVMSFKGERTALVSEEEGSTVWRWKGLVSTPERRDMFRSASGGLLQQARSFSISIPLDDPDGDGK